MAIDINLPDEKGHFGEFGGRYVSETLIPALTELQNAYEEAKKDPNFQKEIDYYLKNYVGRPTPLYFAERMTRETWRCKDISQEGRCMPHWRT